MTNPNHNFNNLVQAILTDKYQLSMSYAFWRDGRQYESAVFDLYFRKNPFKGEYTIFAGLEECLKYVENFAFQDDDIEYLKKIPDFTKCESEFWDYLKGLNSKDVKVYAMSEGTVCFPNLPLIRAEGPLGFLLLLETALLNLTNYASLICTNAARYKFATNSGNLSNCRLLEFGLRRAQGPDGGFSASRYSYIGGFDASSNLLAGKLLGIPVTGTLSHAYITSYFGSPILELDSIKEHKFLLNKKTNTNENFTLECLNIEIDYFRRGLHSKRNNSGNSISNEKGELKSFISFACAFPNSFLTLVDTYDVVRSGLINFCIVAIGLFRFGYKPIGIRIDSGDLAYLSRCARDTFSLVASTYDIDEFHTLEIVASNDINEEIIHSLSDQNHAITMLGIGTNLVTCQGHSALGCVYKLVETNGAPCMKLSSMPEKITIPCKKSIYRFYGRDQHALLDLIVMDSEPKPEPGQRILCRHPFAAEKRCYVTPTRVERLLQLYWDGHRTQDTVNLTQIRNHSSKSLSYLREDIKRYLNPTPYKVSVSENLFNLLNQLKLNLTPVGELS